MRKAAFWAAVLVLALLSAFLLKRPRIHLTGGPALRAKYGDGCVVWLEESRAARSLNCSLPGFVVGYAMITDLNPGRPADHLEAGAIGTSKTGPAASDVAVDLYAPNGRSLGSMPRWGFYPNRLKFGERGLYVLDLPPGVHRPLFVAFRIQPHRFPEKQ